MKKKTKVIIPISLERKLSDLIDDNIFNKSKYIEWLVYQDLKKFNVNGIEKIII